MGESLRIAAYGMGLRLVATLASQRLIEAYLFGVHATDPRTPTGVSMGLFILAAAAAAVPARWAA